MHPERPCDCLEVILGACGGAFWGSYDLGGILEVWRVLEERFRGSRAPVVGDLGGSGHQRPKKVAYPSASHPILEVKGRGSSGQAPGSQKGAWRFPKDAQEATTWSKNRVRAESENMQKVMEGIAKIDFWRPGGGARGRKNREK